MIAIEKVPAQAEWVKGSFMELGQERQGDVTTSIYVDVYCIRSLASCIVSLDNIQRKIEAWIWVYFTSDFLYQTRTFASTITSQGAESSDRDLGKQA